MEPTGRNMLRRAPRRVLLAAIAAVAAVQASGYACGCDDDYDAALCIPSVEAYLRQGGVDPASVASIRVDAQFRTNNDGDRRFQGWQGWVRFTDRDGAVVFSMQRDCRLRSTWTRGDVQWPGPGAT